MKIHSRGLSALVDSGRFMEINVFLSLTFYGNVLWTYLQLGVTLYRKKRE